MGRGLKCCSSSRCCPSAPASRVRRCLDCSPISRPPTNRVQPSASPKAPAPWRASPARCSRRRFIFMCRCCRILSVAEFPSSPPFWPRRGWRKNKIVLVLLLVLVIEKSSTRTRTTTRTIQKKSGGLTSHPEFLSARRLAVHTNGSLLPVIAPAEDHRGHHRSEERR